LNKRIVVRIFGGIGNQLFCYAVAKSIALNNNAELIIDHITDFQKDKYGRFYQLDNFNISASKAKRIEILHQFLKLWYRILRHLSSIIKFENRFYIRHEGVDFDERILKLNINKITYLEGCWQSEEYFIKNQLIIRDEFQIDEPKDIKNQILKNQILEKESVFIHYRFFDDKINGHNNTNIKYYEKAIDFIENKISNAHYYIFSDNIDKALSIIKLPPTKFTVVDINHGELNAHKDLWLMSNCKHSIIANSTFSWWGAWLIDFSKKIVIAPNFKILNNKLAITAWGFEGLIPESWIKIDI
jgi:hypothetical protein